MNKLQLSIVAIKVIWKGGTIVHNCTGVGINICDEENSPFVEFPYLLIKKPAMITYTDLKPIPE